MERERQLDVVRNGLIMAKNNTTPIYCKSCGVYLGEAVPNYLKVAQCFCGEIISITESAFPASDFDDEYAAQAVAY